MFHYIVINFRLVFFCFDSRSSNKFQLQIDINRRDEMSLFVTINERKNEWMTEKERR